MRSPLALVSCVVALAGGCQTAQLNESTVVQAKSVTDVYYDQIMDNIAMLAEHPASLPYFSLPSAGQTSTQYSVNVNYTANLDLLAATSTIPAYLGKYVFDKHTGYVTGGDTNIEQWNTKPTCDPDQILLMKFAYEYIFGEARNFHYLEAVLNPNLNDGKDAKAEKVDKPALMKQIVITLSGISDREAKVLGLQNLLIEKGFGTTWTLTASEVERLFTDLNLNDAQKKDMAEWLRDRRDIQIRRRAIEADRLQAQPLARFRPDYTRMLSAGWFAVGKKRDVPKGACHVGHCGRTYAWVIPGQEEALSDFALVILDITTYQPPYRTQPPPSAPAIGRAATR